MPQHVFNLSKHVYGNSTSTSVEALR